MATGSQADQRVWIQISSMGGLGRVWDLTHLHIGILVGSNNKETTSSKWTGCEPKTVTKTHLCHQWSVSTPSWPESLLVSIWDSSDPELLPQSCHPFEWRVCASFAQLLGCQTKKRLDWQAHHDSWNWHFHFSTRDQHLNMRPVYCLVVCRHLWNLQSLVAHTYTLMLQLQWH